MMIYTTEDLLRVAKRLNNSRRNYLLVNPLQGKHMPVSPTAAINMMNALGSKVAAEFPNARLVVGFAETATAVGAVVAENLRGDCFYLQTTREPLRGNFVEFLEEHSHAPEQRLCTENFADALNQTSEVVFVDDELSTGKTLRNIVRQLKENFPALNGKKICAASIINRLSQENLQALAEENISCVALLKLNQDFDADKFSVTEPANVAPANVNASVLKFNFNCDARHGVVIGDYFAQCEKLADKICGLNISGDVLVLGTEEFMLPALIVGRALEKNFRVKTHSTTRSPIAISTAENYPIRSGVKIRSLYADRTTYIYNLQHCGTAVIITDAQDCTANDLLAALDADKIFLVEATNVQHL